jgi:hypothetical protein
MACYWQGPALCWKHVAGPLILTCTSKPIPNAVVQPCGVAAIRTSSNRPFHPLNRCRPSGRRAAMPRYALPCTIAREAR